MEYLSKRVMFMVYMVYYRSNKKQFVDGCVSGLLGVTCGVPQGPIVGPRLFVL